MVGWVSGCGVIFEGWECETAVEVVFADGEADEMSESVDGRTLAGKNDLRREVEEVALVAEPRRKFA